jgi:Protein of unknown function (DUF2530)
MPKESHRIGEICFLRVRLANVSKERRLLETAHVPPADVNGVLTIAIGTAVWVVALLVSLPFRARLEAAGNGWWLWTCVAAIGLGVVGELYCLDRRRRIRRANGSTDSAG